MKTWFQSLWIQGKSRLRCIHWDVKNQWGCLRVLELMYFPLWNLICWLEIPVTELFTNWWWVHLQSVLPKNTTNLKLLAIATKSSRCSQDKVPWRTDKNKTEILGFTNEMQMSHETQDEIDPILFSYKAGPYFNLFLLIISTNTKRLLSLWG